MVNHRRVRFRRLLFCTFIDCFAMMMILFWSVFFTYLFYLRTSFLFSVRVFIRGRWYVIYVGLILLLAVVALLSADFWQNVFFRFLSFVSCGHGGGI